ncbi:MAG: alpha-amylase domain-containing protein, partial [Cyanobacteria bacterium J06621_11]
VVLSNGDEGVKKMDIGHANTTYIDATEHIEIPVSTDENGWGEFPCEAGSVSVWVPQHSPE